MKKLFWLILVALLIVLCPVISGEMAEYNSAILLVIGIYVILAVSLDLVVGYTGLISLGHAAFFAIGAYTSGILTTKLAIPSIIALGAGVLISSLIAWLIGFSVLAMRGYYLAMGTMALSAIVYTLLVSLQGLTGGATGLRDVPSFSIFGFSFDNTIHYYYFVWGIVILIIICCLRIVKSPFGTALIAIHGDEVAAGTVGVDCPKYKTTILVFSSICASLAGSLYSHYMGFLAPDDFNIFTSIHVLIMIFLGGAGTIYGPILGAIFLKLLPEITYMFHDYELLANGLILILVLVFVPKGLFGLFTTLTKKLT